MNQEVKVNKKEPSYLKRNNRGGLLIGFIYVSVFMSILGLAIWQNYESNTSKSFLSLLDERLILIEEQINIVDETNNDSMTDIASSIQFLDKEIRKLWDLSNKRNKVNINRLEKKTDEMQILLKSIENQIIENKTSIRDSLNIINKNQQDIESINNLAEEMRMANESVDALNTQLILMDDSIQALINYRNQLNQAILEIQTDISILKLETDKNLLNEN
tara:strand:+ start:11880 stop:12533 length:654 start_codon:yes stop_codon:yes gene_type:complete